MSKYRLIAASILLGSISLNTAVAAPITIDISGLVSGTDTVGAFGTRNAVLDGKTFDFNITFDTTAPSIAPTYPGISTSSNSLRIGDYTSSINNAALYYWIDPNMYPGTTMFYANIYNYVPPPAYSSIGENIQIVYSSPDLPKDIRYGYSADEDYPYVLFNAVLNYGNANGYELLVLETDHLKITGDLSPVPIPSSAPLFGFALLGLGAFGYGMKRRSQERIVS